MGVYVLITWSTFTRVDSSPAILHIKTNASSCYQHILKMVWINRVFGFLLRESELQLFRLLCKNTPQRKAGAVQRMKRVFELVRMHWRTGRHFTGGAEKICPENNNFP